MPLFKGKSSPIANHQCENKLVNKRNTPHKMYINLVNSALFFMNWNLDPLIVITLFFLPVMSQTQNRSTVPFEFMNCVGLRSIICISIMTCRAPTNYRMYAHYLCLKVPITASPAPTSSLTNQFYAMIVERRRKIEA